MTHNLLIYPSTLPGEPFERYSVQGMTLEQWLYSNVPSYAPGPEQPISATVNGVVVPPEQWADTWIGAETCVELRPEPKDPASLIIAAVVAVVAVAATFLLMPSIPGQNSKTRRGSSIYEANAQGNAPKLGDVIPEIAGRHKTFPDYLTAPRRRFISPREQALDLLLCVGRGDYTIPDDEIKIGSTPISSLGNDVDYQIFGPGENVSGHIAHRRWFNAPEVGASTGTSGLRLKGLSGGDRSYSGNVTASGDTLQFEAPSGWEGGLELTRCDLTQPVVVTDGDTDADILSGSFQHISAGQAVTIRGVVSFAGEYVVATHTPTQITLETMGGTPVTDISAGIYEISIDRSGVRYLIIEQLDEPQGIRCSRLLSDRSIDSTWSAFPLVGNVPAQLRVDPNTSSGFWAGPFLACPEGESTTRIEWDIFAPSGLGYIEDSGDIVTSEDGHDVELQWRAAGTPRWTSVIQSPSGKTRDQLGFTYSINLPWPITPEVRVRRVNAEATSTQALDRLEWYGLRSELPGAPSRYPGTTVLALTLIGSDTIASQTENQVSVVATRRLPVRAGGAWQPAVATRNIAPWIAYVAKSVGYTDAEIDYDELDRLDATWKARGDYFDFVTDDDSTVKETLNRALRAGMAELTVDAGRLRPVRDEPRSTFEHGYSPQNMLGPLKRSVQAPRPDDADGVDVEYFSSDTWTKETVECRLPGDNGFKVEKLKLDGVTSRTKAWQIGMRERRRMKYRRWSYSFETELDALNSRYMSYCALLDDVPGYGQSALIEDIDGDVIRSSEPLEWADGESYVIAWRRPDGTLAGPYAATQGADDYHVISSMTEYPEINRRGELPHLYFGTLEEWSFPALITDINPQGFESVSVTATNYDLRIYADDNNAPS